MVNLGFLLSWMQWYSSYVRRHGPGVGRLVGPIGPSEFPSIHSRLVHPMVTALPTLCKIKRGHGVWGGNESFPVKRWGLRVRTSLEERGLERGKQEMGRGPTGPRSRRLGCCHKNLLWQTFPSPLSLPGSESHIPCSLFQEVLPSCQA